MSDAGGRLIVVGAGPAGLSAALAGAEGGLDVTVIDELARPGGQYFRGRQELDSGRIAAPFLAERSRYRRDDGHRRDRRAG